MRLAQAVIEELKVKVGHPAGLEGRSTAATAFDWRLSTDDQQRAVADEDLHSFVGELAASQASLWASDSHALLVVLQSMDAAGKDGTIKHVMSGVNPQGCQVTAFKQPSDEELAHDFLWRYSKALPERGRIGIFNRSYYEEVLVVRVHPELLGRRFAGPSGRPKAAMWRQRYQDINAFERHLHRHGTQIVKIFLNISQQEQKKRLLARLGDPNRYWKFSAGDLAERGHWSEYLAAYEEALTATSTSWAPWYVVPADHKHSLRALVAGILVNTINEMDLERPELDPDELEALARAKAELLAE
jgi:PPK2 family polyphosphate:nucleotide phosphotransferase